MRVSNADTAVRRTTQTACLPAYTFELMAGIGRSVRVANLFGTCASMSCINFRNARVPSHFMAKVVRARTWNKYQVRTARISIDMLSLKIFVLNWASTRVPFPLHFNKLFGASSTWQRPRSQIIRSELFSVPLIVGFSVFELWFSAGAESWLHIHWQMANN